MTSVVAVRRRHNQGVGDAEHVIHAVEGLRRVLRERERAVRALQGVRGRQDRRMRRLLDAAARVQPSDGTVDPVPWRRDRGVAPRRRAQRRAVARLRKVLGGRRRMHTRHAPRPCASAARAGRRNVRMHRRRMRRELSGRAACHMPCRVLSRALQPNHPSICRAQLLKSNFLTKNQSSWNFRGLRRAINVFRTLRREAPRIILTMF